MVKHTPDEKIDMEKETFTKDELMKVVAEAQQRQFQADDTRAYGNAFFAEALDHIGTLAQRDNFWKRVFQYGNLFKHQFEMNTGQVQPEQPQKEPVKSTPAPQKKPLPAEPEATAGSDDGS